MNIIIDKTNFINWLEQILEYVKKWAKITVKIEEIPDELDYKDFMEKIDEDIKKEWVKFERMLPKNVYESLGKWELLEKLEKRRILLENN